MTASHALFSDAEKQRIEREIRHARATQWPAGDSWIRGYAEDCAALLNEIAHLREALEEIANADYRGNRSPEAEAAWRALNA